MVGTTASTGSACCSRRRSGPDRDADRRLLHPPTTLTAAELVAAGESAQVEFKSTARCNLHTGQRDDKIEMVISKTVAALANSGGGDLLIGVDDDGKALGLDDDLKFMKQPDLDRYGVWLRDHLSRPSGRRRARTSGHLPCARRQTRCATCACSAPPGRCSCPRAGTAGADVGAGGQLDPPTRRRQASYAADHWGAAPPATVSLPGEAGPPGAPGNCVHPPAASCEAMIPGSTSPRGARGRRPRRGPARSARWPASPAPQGACAAMVRRWRAPGRTARLHHLPPSPIRCLIGTELLGGEQEPHRVAHPSCAAARRVAPPNGMMPRPISNCRKRTSSAAMTMSLASASSILSVNAIPAPPSPRASGTGGAHVPNGSKV